MIIKNLFQYKQLFHNSDNSAIKVYNHDNSNSIVKRNYGIDLLRIISMIKIIILHSNIIPWTTTIEFFFSKI